MTSRTLITLLLTISGLLLSCMRNPEADSLMDHAEAIIEEHPDSALALMQSLNGLKLSHRAQNARRALLLSLAMHKNYIDVTDDSLISIADNYYSASDDLRCRMLARFCHGIVQYNSARYAEAIVSALRAESDASALRDTLWLARTNELMTDIYSQSHLCKEDISKNIAASYFYSKAGRMDNACYSALGLASSYIAYDSIDQAIMTINRVIEYESYNPDCDSILLGTAYGDLVAVYNHKKDLNKVRESFDKACQYKSIRGMKTAYIYGALTEIEIGDMKKGIQLLDASVPMLRTASDTAVYLSAKYMLYFKSGNVDSSLSTMDKLYLNQHRMIDLNLKDSVSKAQSDYYACEKQTSINKLAHRKAVIICLVSALCAIVVVGIYLYRRNLIKNEINHEEAIRAIKKQLEEETRSVIAEKMDLNHRLKMQLHAMLTDQFKTINKLCDEFLYAQNSADAQKSLYNSVKSLIDTLKSEKYLNELEMLINENCDNLIMKMRNQLADFSEKDFRFIILCISGLSSKTICMILDIKDKAFYARRHRLKEKILKSNVDNTQDFLGAFD